MAQSLVGDMRGVRCTICNWGGVREDLAHTGQTSPAYCCPNCFGFKIVYNSGVDNMPNPTAHSGKIVPASKPTAQQADSSQSILDQAIAAGAPIERTAKPKKDMRVPSFEEKEAERERLRAAVAKEFGWT